MKPCSKCLTPKTHYRPVSIQVQLNQKFKVHPNTIASINPDTAHSIYSLVSVPQERKVHTNTIANININLKDFLLTFF